MSVWLFLLLIGILTGWKVVGVGSGEDERLSLQSPLLGSDLTISFLNRFDVKFKMSHLDII